MKKKKILKSIVFILVTVIVLFVMYFVSRLIINYFDKTTTNEELETIEKYNQSRILLNEKIDYIEIEVEDETNLDEIQYTEPVRIKENYKINELVMYINDSKEIEDFEEKYGAGGYFEGSPIVTFYMKDSEKITIMLCDKFAKDETGKWINIMGITKKEDYSDKEFYEVNYNLEEFIKKMYEQI